MSFIIGTPHVHNAGYHRYDGRTHGEGVQENDVQTCPHCQAVIKMQEWKKASVQNFCTRCMKPTCDAKSCVEDCIPYLKILERQYDAVVKYQQYLKRLGL